jgi:hypothetical protein
MLTGNSALVGGWQARLCAIARGAAVVTALAMLPLPQSAPAADQLVLGRKLKVSNPQPADPAQRLIAASAAEDGAAPLSGDPTLPGGFGGAVLEIAALGGTASSQTFSLDQGLRANGTPYWRALGSKGFAYADPKGERGPVKSLKLKRTDGGSLRFSVKLLGRNGPLDVVPPNPGTSGFVALSLSNGDRYCAGFGTGAAMTNRGDRLWRVGSVTAESCAPLPLTSGELLALSYNVAGLPEPLSGSHPLVNTPIISPLLNPYDLVLVQESWQTPDPNTFAPLRGYHELLVVDATHPYKSVPLPQPLGSDPARPTAFLADGLAVFSRAPFTGVQHDPWDSCWETAADCLARKGFMVARTTFAPGVTIDVYTLHLEAGGDPEDEVVREQNVTELVALINTYSAGRPLIVGGDFNLHTDDEPDSTTFQRLLMETGLSDVCAALSCAQPGRIDKFLFRSAAGITITPLSWQFETATFVDPMGDPLSDHDPLAVRFRWETN